MPRYFFALLFVFTCWRPTTANACSCVGPGPACTAVWTTDVVFVGRATTSTHFKVERKVRGSVPAEIDLEPHWGNCAYPFTAGERYVVYAYRNPQTQELTTSICTRTAPVDKAGEDLAFFDELKRPAKGSRVYGRIRQIEVDYGTGSPIDRGGLANLPLTLTSGDRTLRLSTDASGSFEFAGLNTGTYRFAVSLPPAFVPWRPFDLRLDNDRTCQALDSVAQLDGRIRGIVTADDGKPLAGVRVEATAAAALADSPRPRTASAMSNQDGAFEIGPLPAGDFIVGTDFSRRQPPPKLDRRRYYPGVRNLEAARVVHLDAGTHVTLEPFRLPPLPTERTIQVVVLDPDGNVVPGATVTLYGSRPEDHVTPDGRMSFTLPFGARFDVSAPMQVMKNGRRAIGQSGFSIDRDDADRTLELRLKFQ